MGTQYIIVLYIWHMGFVLFPANVLHMLFADEGNDA